MIWGSMTRYLKHGIRLFATDTGRPAKMENYFMIKYNICSIQRADELGYCAVTQNSEHRRHYHTLDHIADMLEGADIDFIRLQKRHVVRLAIFFHDLVYDPKSGKNEEDSDIVFREFAKEAGLTQLDTDLVSAYIIATKQHHVSGSDDEDLRAFIDLDMAVVGRERDGYLQYASQIRQEYIHVPQHTYCRKRAEVLRSFLAKERIYATEHYHQHLEATARANVATEIAILDTGRTVE